MKSGSAIMDAPLSDGSWLIEKLQGRFLLVGFGDNDVPRLEGLETLEVSTQERIALSRYGDGNIYLSRPDGHVAASFETAKPEPVLAALRAAQGGERHV